MKIHKPRPNVLWLLHWNQRRENNCCWSVFRDIHGSFAKVDNKKKKRKENVEKRPMPYGENTSDLLPKATDDVNDPNDSRDVKNDVKNMEKPCRVCTPHASSNGNRELTWRRVKIDPRPGKHAQTGVGGSRLRLANNRAPAFGFSQNFAKVADVDLNARVE